MFSFYWILKNKLAGASQPGLYEDIEKDISFLKEKGITTIITLTETKESYEEFGMEQIHFPIHDMGIPSPRNAFELCSKIIAEINLNKQILVHCKAGLGRTGTILACCLVNLGNNSNDAINIVRSINKAYIQSSIQEKFIEHYYDFAIKQ
ncbi:MAG: dual specificity protein phosphatase family protein [Cyanobacteriota bacterium]